MDNNKELKPFDKVLVRDDDNKVWTANIFSHYRDRKGNTVEREESAVEYVCMGFTWKQCIPYEGNEHLLGTTEDPERKELIFLKKVIAWNPGFDTVRGYFLDLIEEDGCKFRYKIINAKNKNMEYFQDCVAEEWEE